MISDMFYSAEPVAQRHEKRQEEFMFGVFATEL